jgi:hypothetical protein
VRQRQDPAQAAQYGVLLEVGFVVVALERQPDRGVDQERAEEVEHPARGRDRRGAGQDEHRPQHHRHHDADVEHLVLRERRHREPRHDDDEDEQVVNAEAVLRDVPGDELPTARTRTEDEQPDREQGRQPDVEQHPAGRVLDRDGVVAPGDHDQVERDDHEQTGDRQDPDGRGHHGHHGRTSGRLRTAGPEVSSVRDAPEPAAPGRPASLP